MRAVILGGSVLGLAVASAEGCGGGGDTTAPPGTGGTAVGGHGGSGATGAEGGTGGAQGGTGGAQGGSGGGPACTGSETQPCYEGPDGTQDVGICHAGTSTCTQGQWGLCEDQQIPLAEDCNAIGDEDCNGVPCSELLWSKMVGGSGDEMATAVTADAAGNVIVGGTFSGTVDFGCGALVSAGSADGFLASYSAAAGACLWSLRFGGAFPDGVRALAVDPVGDIVVLGDFVQTITVFGLPLTAGGVQDGFLLKVDPSGGLVWVTHLATGVGATGNKTPRSVAIDPAGDIVLAGSFTGHWSCPLPACDTPSNGYAAFVDKRSGVDGHLLWRKTYDSPSDQAAVAVAAAGDGSVVVGGYFNQTLDLGGGTILTAPTSWYGFVAKLAAADGATVWAKSFGDPATATTEQQVSSVAIAAGDDIVVTGQGAGGVAFASGDVLVSQGSADVFLARYSSSGALVWRGLYGDAMDQKSYGVAVDSADNVILAGAIFGSMDFGGGPLTTAGGYDAFLAKFSGTGVLLWNRSFGGAQYDGALATAVNALDQIALVGYGSSSIDFGGGPLPYAGSLDGFVALFYP